MSTNFETQTERTPGEPSDQIDADIRRRAECAERITRLLSAMGNTEHRSKPLTRETRPNLDTTVSQRLLLADSPVPIGEFGSREEASKPSNELGNSGGSLTSVELKPQEPAAAQAQAPNPPSAPNEAVDSPKRDVIQVLKKADEPADAGPKPRSEAGALPAASPVMRVVGKLFPSSAKTTTLNARPKLPTSPDELLVLGNTKAQLANELGFGHLTLTCAPPTSKYEAINIHYTTALTHASIAAK